MVILKGFKSLVARQYQYIYKSPREPKYDILVSFAVHLRLSSANNPLICLFVCWLYFDLFCLFVFGWGSDNGILCLFALAT